MTGTLNLMAEDGVSATAASASFTNTTDANGSATVRRVGGSASGDVWLNGLMLEELPNQPLSANPTAYR